MGLMFTKVWKEEGPSAYETILIRDCPNLFMIGGPNSATGHSSVVLAIENGCQIFFESGTKGLIWGMQVYLRQVPELIIIRFRTTQKELARSVFGNEVRWVCFVVLRER